MPDSPSTKIKASAGMQWLQAHLDYCVRPLLDEPWVLDVDATIKPLYGHQEGAVVGYNPRRPGRPSHCYHTYMLSDLRLVLRVEVHPGDKHNPKHAAAGLWSLLAPLGRECWPRTLSTFRSVSDSPHSDSFRTHHHRAP